MAAATLFGAALQYVLPLGVGLLLTRALAPRLTRTQLLLLSYLVGLIAIACVFVSRERGWGFASPRELLDAAVLLAAVAGFVAARRVFRWDAAARAAAADFAWVVPFFAVGFALRFGVFSDYPVTDLFQFAHVMKAALEFGRFDRLNPFTADSYAPVLPVLEGLVVRALGYEPLEGFWFVSALSVVPKFLAVRAAVLATLVSGEARILAIAATACFVSPLPSTNGELAMLGALLLFARIAADASARPAATGLALAVALVGYAAAHVAARRLDALAYLAVLVLVCALPRLRVAATSRIVAPLALLPLVFALAPLHRGAMVLVPVGAVCGWLLAVIRRQTSAGTPLARALPRVAVAVGAAVGAEAVALLAYFLGNPQEDFRDNPIARWVVETLLGQALAGEVLLGSGPKVALFEIARAMSPSAVLMAAMALVLAWRFGANERRDGEPADRATPALHATGAWVIALTLAGFLLLGLPFTYRAGFFVVVLLAIVLGAAAETARRGMRDGASDRVLLGAALVYVAWVVPIAYQCAPFATCRGSGYLDMARPYLWVLGSACAVAALVALIVGLRWRLPVSVVPAILGSVFAFEFAVEVAYFMPYHYGPADRSAPAVSHLSREETELAGELRRFGADVVLLSDPHTLSNLKALTGLTGLFTASNLDTMRPEAAGRLREWLRAVLESGGATGSCAPEPPLRLRDSWISPEFDYWLMRRAAPSLSGRDALRAFAYRDSLLPIAVHRELAETDARMREDWVQEAIAKIAASARQPAGKTDSWSQGPMILLVVNRKTAAWAMRGGDLPYYPDVRSLDEDLLGRLAGRCDMRVHDGRFALIRFALAKP